MAFSKARRLSDSISATGEVSAFVDGAIVAADLNSTLDLTGKTITVANASTGDSDTTVANTAFVQQEIAALVASAPGTLNTLNELAAALGDDASFSTTITNSIAAKAPLASPTLTGTPKINVGTNKNIIFSGGIGEIGSVPGFQGINDAGSANTDIGMRGTTIRFATGSSERMRIDSAGIVGIGTSSPSSYDSRSNNLVVGDSGDAGITIFSGATSNARLQFAPSGSTGLDNGLIDYDNNDDSMAFATGGTERMRIAANGLTTIDASSGSSVGNLRVKGTSGHSYIGVSRAAASQGEVGYTWNNNVSNVWWNYLSANSSILNWYSTTGTKMTLNNSSGDLNVTAGNVVMSNGKGIDFSATSGGGTSELLDDYEEGTWTPAITGAASGSGQQYTSRAGSYVKIGRSVTANFSMVLSAKGNMSGSLKIIGLPFNGISNRAQAATLLYGSMDLDANQQLVGYQYAVNPLIYLFYQENDTALVQLDGVGAINNNTEIQGSVTYFTDS
jgi:hypothetical protein